MTCRSAVLAIFALTLSVAAVGARLPNYDAVADAPRVAPASSARVLSALATMSPARVQWDDRFGVPTFVWPSTPKQSGAVAAARIGETAESAAREYLRQYAPLYGLTAADVADAYVAKTHDTGRGAIVVKLRQKIGDVAVFRDEMNVVLTRDHDLVALSGHISALPRTGTIATMSVAASPFMLSAASAISSATSVDINRLRFLENADGGYQLYGDDSGASTRVKRVYFHLPDHYEPAYYVEAYIGGDDTTSPDLYSYVVSAIDGRLLFRNDMTVDDAPPSFSYRVWATPDGNHLPFSGPQGYDGTPNPTGSLDGYQPTFIAPSLITLAHGPISTNDPWLAPNATETVGNNADAYADLASPDGFSTGDLRANLSSPLIFDRTYDVAQPPQSSTQQQMAAITNLFYDVNFLHDWYYDAGFNEAAGNAQTDNYGRGGIGNDNIRAEAQDYGGRNNANMSVPSDGGRPRMQMYLWDGAGRRNLEVDAPTSIAKSYVSGIALFGPSSYDMTGTVVGTSPADACTLLTTSITGKIAFVNRGTCNFTVKVQNAKAAGAIGVIVGNIATSGSPESITNMACSSSPCSAVEQALPPAMHVAFSDAETFRANLGNGIQVRMQRVAAVDRDGDIDNQVIAHEWTHYLSNRLVADSNGLVNMQSRGMGEGWSDFNSMLLTVRADDTRFASNATFNGAYGVAVYVMTGGSNGPLQNDGDYYGIRRVPYSSDIAKDPLTLKDVMNGVPITGAPVRAGADGANNSEVHNTGEVWCTILWEAYTALLRDTLGAHPRLSFAEAQQRMKEYLVASLKITPPSPTFLEARDAVLAAAFARDKTDYAEFWQAFAKRGAGINAVAPDRYSTVNAGVTEDFNGSGGMAVTAVTIDDSITSCLKNGALDAGETGVMQISLKNVGGVALASTSVQVTSSDAALSFANNGTTTIPASNPGDTVVATINASLASGAKSIVNPDITIDITDPQIPTDGGIKAMYQPQLNAFEAPKSSMSDDVESSTTAWTVAGSGAAKWGRLEISARDHRWFAPEPWDAADEWLVSPPMIVAPGDFSFSFKHRFAFDFFQDTSGKLYYIDGGVIELSTDDGATWTDIGDKIDPSTTHYGTVGIYPKNGSAIDNRVAFEGTSPGFVADTPSTTPFTTTVVNLGTGYAGKRVRIRFRSVTGSDHSLAARQGWDIDDIAFSGLANLPFSNMTADHGGCSVATSTTSLAASTATVQFGLPVTFTATISASIAPEGTVDFFDSGAIIGTARVTNGKAQLTTIALFGDGNHPITGVFNGDKYFKASTSQAVTVQVTGSTGRHRTVHH